MEKQTTTTKFRHKLHLLILRKVVLYANAIGLITWLFLRIIFYDLPFVFGEELLILGKIILWSTGIAVGASFIIFAVDGIRYLVKNRKRFRVPGVYHVPEHS